MSRLSALAAAVVISTAVAGGSAVAFDGWHQSSSVVIEGKVSGFDYITLDASRGHLFLGRRKDGLQVYDLASKKVIKVFGGDKPTDSNGALIIPDLDLGVSNEAGGTLLPFSLSTLEAREPVKVCKELDTSYYEPVTKRIFAHCEGDDNGSDLVVVDATSLQVLRKIRLLTKEAEHGVADGKGNYYLAARELGYLYQFDAKAMAMRVKWPTDGCNRPTGLAYNAADDRVLIGCRGDADHKAAFAVFDPGRGQVVAIYDNGHGNDAVIHDPDLNRVFLANGVGANLLVYERAGPDSYKLVEALGTRPMVKTLAYDPKTKTLHAMTAESSTSAAKKINVKNGTFYPNTYYPNTFTVLTYSK